MDNVMGTVNTIESQNNLLFSSCELSPIYQTISTKNIYKFRYD